MPASNTLSFTELDRRLREVPEGPAAVLNTPPLYRIANIIGGIAAISMLIPFLLVRVMTPGMWMITWVQIGFSVFLVALLPGLVHSYGILGWTLWRWREEQVSQLDHDLPYFRQILDWLGQFPEVTLIEHHRVARMVLAQSSAKIGLLAGGVDRLGFLPVLGSAYLFLRNWNDLLDMPAWQLLLGFGLILLYFVITTANLRRIRLQLYESLLAEALVAKPA